MWPRVGRKWAAKERRMKLTQEETEWQEWERNGEIITENALFLGPLKIGFHSVSLGFWRDTCILTVKLPLSLKQFQYLFLQQNYSWKGYYHDKRLQEERQNSGSYDFILWPSFHAEHHCRLSPVLCGKNCKVAAVCARLGGALSCNGQPHKSCMWSLDQQWTSYCSCHRVSQNLHEWPKSM